MPSYVAFLRAVNVGGRFVKMAELRSELEGAGFTDVETHIQSGNVFVRSGRRSTGAVGTEMARVLGEWAGFDVPCVVRTPAQLRSALAAIDAVPPLLDGARRYVAFADGPRGAVIGNSTCLKVSSEYSELTLRLRCVSPGTSAEQRCA